MDFIPNVLAERYASSGMKAIWSPSGRIRLERDLWIAILKAQREIGLPVAEGAIEAYESVIDQIDLEDIRQREAVTRHDVKARIESFCDLAGHQEIHKGMTSRDLTENVEQLQVFRSLQLIQHKTTALLHKLATRVEETASLVITARTHNVAAQPTTFGKRLAMFGDDLLHAAESLDHLLSRYPVRGLQGAVGTRLDLLTLLQGDQAKAEQLDQAVRRFLGIPEQWHAVGQVYPRSLDFEVVSLWVTLGSGPASLAKTLRIMAGHETASEGFAPGQVGSSAMPHKMNSRSCERLNGLHVLLKGYASMASQLAGDQWNEGDVSCSVVRRVVLPDSCFAIDALLDTCWHILNQMEVYQPVIERENQHYLPFLCSTTFLMQAVQKGVGREAAHAAIKQHAVATVKDLRTGNIRQNDLLQRLANDKRLGLSLGELQSTLDTAESLTGLARQQCATFAEKVEQRCQSYPKARDYQAEAML